jgi:hypothetical protein
MGQKVHPEAMRVGYIHDWKSNWFSEKNFSDFLIEDARTPLRWRSTSTPRGRAS